MQSLQMLIEELEKFETLHGKTAGQIVLNQAFHDSLILDLGEPTGTQVGHFMCIPVEIHAQKEPIHLVEAS